MSFFTSLAKKAAEVALGQGAKAVKSAIASARKSIFGAEDAVRHEDEKPDPFAKLKAAEAAKKKLEK